MSSPRGALGHLEWCGGLLLATLLLGCPGTLENPERFLTVDAGEVDAGPSCDVEGQIFVQRCGPCHTMQGQTFPDLTSPDVKTRLLQGVSASCNNAPLGPHLVEKMKGTHPPSCGAQMPAVPVPQAEMDCVEAYIQQLLDGGT